MRVLPPGVVLLVVVPQLSDSVSAGLLLLHKRAVSAAVKVFVGREHLSGRESGQQHCHHERSPQTPSPNPWPLVWLLQVVCAPTERQGKGGFQRLERQW